MNKPISLALSFRIPFPIIAVAVLVYFSQASAFKIGSASVGTEYPNIHESITLLAQQCLATSTGEPENCWLGDTPIGDIVSYSRDLLESNTIAYASRWPDDPTRHLDNPESQPKFGATMFTDCEPVLNNGDHIDTAGLLCSSHYGRLQFMHAMESSPYDETETTRAKIVAWAKFAYRVATETSLRSSDFCDTVADEEYVDSVIQDAFQFYNSKFCDDRLGTKFLIIPTMYPAWKISTFFSFTCSFPINSTECWEKSGVAGDEAARVAAIGALLHLVQDSYSQSHVARAEAGLEMPFESRVVCAPALKYFNYAAQMATNGEAHEGADYSPVLDTSCSEDSDDSRAIDDVITASAMVLWHVEQGDVAQFIQYLENKVLGKA